LWLAVESDTLSSIAKTKLSLEGKRKEEEEGVWEFICLYACSISSLRISLRLHAFARDLDQPIL
jgi:hypothetical protein